MLVTEARETGFTDPRLKAISTGLLNARERASIETQKNLLAEKSYQLHLANATHHLASGNLSLANAEIALGRSLGINDDSLSLIASRIKAQEQQQAASLLEIEIDKANLQFEQLLQAIQLRNARAITSLTTGTNRGALFSGLFDRYIEVNASLTGLSVTPDNSAVSATLRLDNMRLPNGNLTYPPSSYGEIQLSLTRTQKGWSKIQW